MEEIKRRARDALKNSKTMRGPAKLGGVGLPLTGPWNFIPPLVEREQGAHSTRLRNHKSKWYRFEMARLDAT